MKKYTNNKFYTEWPTFNWKFYLDNNPDLIQNNIINEEDAIKHFLKYGKNENRMFYEYDQLKKNDEDTEPDIYLNIIHNSNRKLFSLKKKQFINFNDDEETEYGDKISNIFIHILDIDICINDIIKIYELFNSCYCSILCPTVKVNNKLQYFGGYVLNNKSYLINDQYYQSFDKYHEQYYNKLTSIIFKNFFITNNKDILYNIINNEYIYQYIEHKAIVSPFLDININPNDFKSQSFIQNIHRTTNDESFINNNIIIENHLLQSKYFVGNIFLKKSKKVLICENSILTPYKDCGSLYMTEFIKSLLKTNYCVHFFSVGNMCYLNETEYFKQMGVYVHYNKHNYQYKTFENFLKFNSSYFDYIFISRYYQCHIFRKSIRKYSPRSKLIYVTHDIAHLRTKDEKKKTRIKNIEIKNIKYCDLSLIVSNDEMNYLNRQVSSDKLFYYPILYESIEPHRLPMTETKDIYFIGSRHSPNIEAMQHFLENIWPIINVKNPDIILHILGSVSLGIKKRYCNVKIYGCISKNDLFYFIKNCRITIVPLLSGGGIKGKMLEAMNNKVPIVSSNIGVQGISLEDNVDYVLINPFNNYELCADKIIDTYNNINLLENCSANSKKYFEKYFSTKNNNNYNDNMFKKLDLIQNQTINTKHNKCIILCVVYNYKDIIASLVNFFENRAFDIQFTFYFIINSYTMFDELKDTYLNNTTNIHILKGDQSCHEISGYTKAISYLKDTIDNYNCIIITNETLLTTIPTGHIYHNVHNDLFNDICTNKNSVAGLIDSYNTEFTLHDKKIIKWLRGNFIIMNVNVLKKINYKLQYFDISDYNKYNNSFNINISQGLLEKIDTRLNQDRYKNYSECSDKLIIKKLCILNELYLYSVLTDFDIYEFKRY